MIPKPMECAEFLKGMLEEWSKTPDERIKPRYGKTVLHFQAAINYLEQNSNIEAVMEQHVKDFHQGA